MTQGSAGKSQSIIGFTPRISASDTDMPNPPSKRNRTDFELQSDNSNVFASDSTITLIANEKHTPGSDHNAVYTIVKLDRKVDKKNRFAIHKEFLNKCIEQKLIPNGLKIELEPSIGNHDEQFLSKWSERMQEFSLTLMKDIVE